MSSGRAIRILVADDNEVNQQVMRGLLEHQGYEVDSVHHGGEVLRALKTGAYDLVIMDCMMPVMDGYEATRAIRSSRSEGFDPDIPVLAITALAAPGDREKCLEAGMNGYIPKPVVAGRLFRKLRELLGAAADRPPRAAAASSDSIADILQSLSGRMLEDLAGWATELERLRASPSPPEIGRLAHTIRGAADLYSATALSRAAAAVERAVREGRARDVPALADTLRQELFGFEQKLRDG